MWDLTSGSCQCLAPAHSGRHSYRRGGARESGDEKERQFGKPRWRNDECYNCGKRRHFARDCQYRRNLVERNVAPSNNSKEIDSEEEWDVQTSFFVLKFDNEKLEEEIKNT